MTDRLDDARSDSLADEAATDLVDRAPSNGAHAAFDTVIADEPVTTPGVTFDDDDLAAYDDFDRDGLDEETGPRPAWWRRAATRLVRRPVAWLTAPWPTQRVVRVVFTVFSLATTTAIMMN